MDDTRTLDEALAAIDALPRRWQALAFDVLFEGTPLGNPPDGSPPAGAGHGAVPPLATRE